MVKGQNFKKFDGYLTYHVLRYSEPSRLWTVKYLRETFPSRLKVFNIFKCPFIHYLFRPYLNVFFHKQVLDKLGLSYNQGHLMFEPIRHLNTFCLWYVFQFMPVNLWVRRLGHLLYPSTHPETLLGQMGYIMPPACSGSTLGPSTSWTFLAYLHREGSSGHLNQMPGSYQPVPFNAK